MKNFFDRNKNRSSKVGGHFFVRDEGLGTRDEMIRELARKLTAFEEFVDCVMVETTLRRGKFEAGAQVVKAHSSMILLRACTRDAELLVKLIRPRSEIKPACGCRIQTAEKIWRVFTASEVFDFAEDVGDRNPIHRFNPPIVPGLLILETICAETSANFIRLKFKNFITADEPLTMRGGVRFEICSGGVRKILGTLE